MQPYHRRGLRAGSCTRISNRQCVVWPARLWPPLLSTLQGRPTRRRIPDVRIRQLPLLSDYGHRNHLLVYVDDTFIFSNSAENIDTVIASVGKHYEVTLDREATSFLGLNLTHNSNGTVTITQPKLLQKIFALYPPRKPSTIAASSRPPSPPHLLMPKLAQSSRLSRNSTFSLLFARNFRSPSNYLQSSWRTTAR